LPAVTSQHAGGAPEARQATIIKGWDANMAFSSAPQIVRQILEGPVARPVLQRWRRQRFFSEAGFAGFFGLFKSFAEARSTLPPNPEFDNAALAAEYVDVRTKKIFAYDYPVMWWLERAFRDGATKVLDIGGSVGVHFYAYRRYIEMPKDLSWRVVEVPAIASIGREMASHAEADASALSFAENLTEVLSGNDIWISAGALHFLDNARPAQLLQQCEQRPRHILLNKEPLYDGEDYVTTVNIGDGCFAPAHVFNRQRFVSEVEALGYTLREQWQVPERSLKLPGFPEHCVPVYSGLYFTR
jgi:putative methyltransferase (TIGR04325 family)